MKPEGEGRTRLSRAGGGARARWTGWLLPAAAFALALAVRLPRLDESCLWFDELFGLHAARHEWGGLLRFVALDLVHPPLFYLLLKVWTALGGESVWWLRLLPALVSSLAVVPVALLGRELRLPERAVALALVLLAASGFLVKYAQEVRMYAPLLLLASCSLWLFARFCRDAGGEDARGRAGDDATGALLRRRSPFVRLVARERPAALVALTCANLLLVYTHYFGWLLVALELAFAALWARGRFKPLAASAFVLAACFAPWAWAVARAGAEVSGGIEQNIGWAARPGARELPLPYLLLHEPFRFQRHSAEPPVLSLTVVMTLALFAPALAALAFRELRRRRGQTRTRAPGAGGREADATRGESARRADAAARANREARADTDREGRVSTHEEHINSDGEEQVNSDGEARADSTGPNTSGLISPGPETFALRFLVFFSAAPVVAAFVLSQVLPQSVWGTRHLVVVAPAYLLLAAHAVAGLRPRWLSVGAQLLLGCWLLLAAAGWLARRNAPLVWCSWEALASQLARAEAGGGPSVNVYATEELAAYHLWHALDGGARGGGARFRVAVVKNVPGATEDRAFFLPRGFDGVRTVDAAEAMREEDFWIAFRAPAADADHALLRALAARGYETTGPRFEATAQGQRVTLARARRR